MALIPNIGTLSVGTTAVLVLEAASSDRPRKSIYVRNESSSAPGTQAITVAYGRPPISGAGYVVRDDVSGYGDVLTDVSYPGLLCWQGQVWAICAAAGGVIAFAEEGL